MAQLAEQLICNQQVIGSSPIIGFYLYEVFRTFSSVGESNRLITGRSWVRVPEGPPYRGIAQLVEQRSPKPRVESSSLSAPAIKKYFTRQIVNVIICLLAVNSKTMAR